LRDIAPIIESMASAIAELRRVLEAESVDEYPAAIGAAQTALDAINGFTGGLEGIRAELERKPEQEKLRLRELITKASIDHKINGELIRLAMKKNAALQAVIAQQSESATYSGLGQVPNVLGSLLSKRV